LNIHKEISTKFDVYLEERLTELYELKKDKQAAEILYQGLQGLIAGTNSPLAGFDDMD